MNLLIKRNIESFLNLLGIQFKTIEEQIELNFELFDFFIEVVDEELFFHFLLIMITKDSLMRSVHSPQKKQWASLLIFLYMKINCA